MTDLVGDPGSVRALAQALRDGTITSRALVTRCLSRIEAVDDRVMAWVSVDTDAALAAAESSAHCSALPPKPWTHTTGRPAAGPDAVYRVRWPSNSNTSPATPAG